MRWLPINTATGTMRKTRWIGEFTECNGLGDAQDLSSIPVEGAKNVLAIIHGYVWRTLLMTSAKQEFN